MDHGEDLLHPHEGAFVQPHACPAQPPRELPFAGEEPAGVPGPEGGLETSLDRPQGEVEEDLPEQSGSLQPVLHGAGLEMQIRWAELDLDCNGDVSYDEFSTLVGSWEKTGGELSERNSLEVDMIPSQSSRKSDRSPKTVQPGNFHRELLRRRLAKGDAMGEVSAMVERKIAEGHASLELKFDQLAKRLLHEERGGEPPGRNAHPQPHPIEGATSTAGCCGGGGGSGPKNGSRVSRGSRPNL